MKVLNKERIFLNQIAQRCTSFEDGESWFFNQPEDRRRPLLRELSAMALQAGFVPADVRPAASLVRLKKGATPCVLLSVGRPKIQMAKVLSLPQSESSSVFKLLIGLLSIADQRRRKQCKADCQHWWHRDLSDESVVADLLSTMEV